MSATEEEGPPIERWEREGAVGAGTGTSCYGWKGGIGTASRVLPPQVGGYAVGALVQSNFGRAEELTIRGVPIGQHLRPPAGDGRPPRVDDRQPEDAPPLGGSIMIVLASDAPLDARGLGRLARRAALGLARTGSTGHGGSGDFVIAFSTANTIPESELLGRNPMPRAFLHEQPILDWLATAVVESVEEAIYNSLLMAHTVVGRNGHTRHALPAEEVARLLAAAGRS